MINLLTMSRFQKPKASTIGTPIFHRKRRSWQDDKDLMLELHSFLSKPDGPYDYFENKVTQFRSKIDSFIDSGFEDNIEVFFLAMWVREQLSALTIQKGSYNLSVDPLELPENVDDIISKEESKTTMRGSGKSLSISISDLFPNPKLRAFALERIQILHRGDLVAYISSLVAREKESLMNFSANIMDLIHICEHKIALRNLKTKNNFAVGETDLWIPELSLGVEVRDTWDENEELSLIQTLSDTNFRKRARNLCLVTPDDLSDAKFLKLREVEKRGVIENLSVIRVGDFANYLDALIETASANK
tara:strand:- start:157 stop:1068 length:912 start_codon:yes stop_codon:yes gene_type:complete